MVETDPQNHTARNARRRAKDRIVAPIAHQLRLAGWLSVAAGLLWPVQAAAISWAVAGWTTGAHPMERAWIAAAVFLICATLRAGLEHRAGGVLFDAADQTIARERDALIHREARTRAGDGSAAIAALVVQKLPLLQPWITRYHVAMMRASILPVVILALAFSQSWVVGLTLLVAGPLIPVFMALVGMAAEDASKRQLDEIGTMNDMVMERLTALLDIRLLGATDRALADFDTRADRLRDRTMAVLRIAFLSSTVLELFAALGVAMVAVFVGFTLLGEIAFGTWGAPLSLGQGLFLLLLAPEYFQPLRDLAGAWHDRAAGFAVMAELDALDAAERVAFVGHGQPSAPLEGAMDIRLTNAVATLPDALVALPDIHCATTTSCALVGPSGVGKTTALAAITGLVPLASGQLEVCGQTLNSETADAWRRRIALMPQRPHFSDTTLGSWLDVTQSGTDPKAALDLADATRIVDRLRDGLQTRLGETGGGVSGGEARRLLLARAIQTGADLILADEPTADLDPETAARVIASFKRLQAAGKTIIVATHDPVLAAAMDQQIEMTP